MNKKEINLLRYTCECGNNFKIECENGYSGIKYCPYCGKPRNQMNTDMYNGIFDYALIEQENIICKSELLKVIKLCTEIINKDRKDIDNLDAAGMLNSNIRNSLELKNAGMRSLRNGLISKYNEL